MQIIIKTKNLEPTDSLRDLINKKINGLGKFVKIFKEDFKEIFVEVEKETRHHKKGNIFFAELIISLPGKKLFAKAHGENLSKAITEVKDEMEREIKKYKTKTIELPRRKYRKIKKQIV